MVTIKTRLQISKKACKNNIFSVKLRQKVNNKNNKEMRLKINEICNR